jgi:protein required for attachment to host cells
MQEQALQSRSAVVTWVLVADAGQARIYLCERTAQRSPLGGANIHHGFTEKADHELTPLKEGLLKAESIDAYQIGHDRRGTSSSSNSPTHNTYEPHGDINEELRHRFMRAVATKLQLACDGNAFGKLVVVAPARMVGELKALWNADILDRIAVVVPKDLVQYHGSALMAHLREDLIDAHVD